MIDINKKTNLSVFFTKVSFFLLCCYVASFSLSYIEFVPSSIKPLMLYAFLGVSFFSVIVRKKVFCSPHTYLYALFLFFCFVSVLYSAYSSVSWSASIGVAKVFIFTLMAYNIVDSLEKVEVLLAVFSSTPVFLLFYLMLTGQLEMSEEGERLGTELTGNANILASLLMFAAMCSVYFVFKSEKKSKKLLFFVFFVIHEYGLALTGSRRNMLMPVVLLCLVLILKIDKDGRRRVIRRSLIVAGIFIALFWAMFEIPFLYDSIGYRMEGLLNYFSGEGTVDASTRIRMNMIDEATALWLEKPLFGNGIDVYKKFNPYGYYSHNNYVELLCSLGVIGFFAYYIIYVFLIYKFFTIKNLGVEKWYWLCFLACICVFEYGGITYNMFETHTFLTLMFVVLKRDVATNDLLGSV